MRIPIKDVIANKDNEPVLITKQTKLYKDLQRIASPKDVVQVMTDVFWMDRQIAEQVYMIALDSRTKPLAFFFLNQGIVNNSHVDVRGLFIRMLLTNASKFILIHNHPSGEAFPSEQDYKMTRRLKELSPIMGIEFCDHIIIGNGEESTTHYSFLKELWEKEKTGASENK